MAMYVFPGGFQLARGVGGSTFATAGPFECYPELKTWDAGSWTAARAEFFDQSVERPER